MTTLNKHLQRLLVDHRLFVLVVFTACFIALAWQATRFRLDASADTLLSKGNKHYIQSQVINQRFAPQEFLLIAYKPRNHDVISEKTFADLQTISQRVMELERVDTARSLLNVPLLSLMQGGVTEDIDPEALTIERANFSLDAIKRVLKDHPIYEDLLINSDQTAAAIQVTFKPHAKLEELDGRIVEIESNLLERPLTDQEKREVEALKEQVEPLKAQLDKQRNQEIEAIREIMAPFEQENELYLGGAHVLGYQLIEIITNDLVIFGGAIGLMICVVLFVLFREFRWVIIPVICCAVSVVMTMGLFGALGLKATVISSNFVALQLILTLAIVLHLVVQYREFHRDDPKTSHLDLIRKTIGRKAAPCFYAGITTSVGFATLLFSGLQPVISFGLMMIVAMFVSIAASLILFPALLAFFDKKSSQEKRSLATRALDIFQSLALKRGGLVIAASIVLLLASLAGALKLSVENSFIDYFRDSTQVHRELSFIDREFGGTTPLDILYSIPDYQKKPDIVLSADTASALQRIQVELSKQEAVGKILSIVNLTELAKRINQGKPLTEYELTALYLTVDEELRDSLLGSFFSEERGEARFSVRIMDSTDNLDRGQLLDDIETSLAGLGMERENYMIAGLFILYEDILQRLFESQILTLGIVFVALTFTFLLVFRSLRIALIAIVPNILSTFLVLGAMGWFNISLDLMTITIAAIAMGIAVDDTIHYIHRYREELEENAADEAVANTHHSVGFAILYTSLLIVVGFSLLGFSDFVPSILFGLLTALSITAALVSDLTVLPVLLRRYVTSKQVERGQMLPNSVQRN